VETSTSRSVVEVVELTRGGTVVRTARFMASRVIALVEHPASEQRRPSPPTDDDALRLALPETG
jgi:hypothetical protein